MMCCFQSSRCAPTTYRSFFVLLIQISVLACPLPPPNGNNTDQGTNAKKDVRTTTVRDTRPTIPVVPKPKKDSGSDDSEAETDASGTQVNAFKFLVLFEEADFGSRKLGVVKENSKVEVLDASKNPWLKVRAKLLGKPDNTGWVMGSFTEYSGVTRPAPRTACCDKVPSNSDNFCDIPAADPCSARPCNGRDPQNPVIGTFDHGWHLCREHGCETKCPYQYP